MKRRWSRPRDWSLATRFVLLSLALLLLVQAAGFAAIGASIDRNTRRTLASDLAVAERIWQRLLEQRATKLAQGAALLAADYGFREAVGSDDLETIASALDNHGSRIGAAVTALLDNAHAVRALVGETKADAAADPQRAAALQALPALAPRIAKSGSAVTVLGGRPYQFVMVPMRAPLPVGWVVMGFEVDDKIVAELHAVSGHHASLVDLNSGRVLHGSLAEDAADGPQLLRDVTLAAGSGITLRLAGSVAQAAAPYRALQWLLAALTAAGLVMFGIGSAWSARRVTRPLAALMSATERLARGDYRTPAATDAVRDRHDEVGVLTRAFDHMRGNIAEQQEQIRRLAYWDRLTGLPNRVQFRDEVQAACADPGGIAVVMLDLDRFKHVNDVLGYDFGDRLLRAVAERLAQIVRPGDVVSRLGGDEFALLLRPADEALARQVAARVASAFEQPLTLDDQLVDLSAGLGIACAPEHAADADSLLSRAEVAMYVAKRRTAGAQVYSPALDNKSAQTLSLLSELRRAVDAGELQLFVQPKIALADASLVGAEALVRWRHPTRGLVPPMEFIPFAEQTGFVRQLTLWVFEEASRHLNTLAAVGVQRLSINLSTRDLMDGELPDKLEAILMRHGLEASAFCLEITESAIMDDPERAEGTLNRLAQRGFKLSIDDFGTGYSSLAYLQRLPVRELKIDKGFVMKMEREAGDQKIVRSTIDLAHNLGLTVVAEGVENAVIQQHLAELGCDEAQGYGIGKPMPISELPAWVERRGVSLRAASAVMAAPALTQ